MMAFLFAGMLDSDCQAELAFPEESKERSRMNERTGLFRQAQHDNDFFQFNDCKIRKRKDTRYARID